MSRLIMWWQATVLAQGSAAIAVWMSVGMEPSGFSLAEESEP